MTITDRQNKDVVAKELAHSHKQVEPTITNVYRIHSPREADAREPIKLLEINTDTVPAGIMPIALGPGGDIVFSTVIVEITPEEFEKLRTGELKFPSTDWQIGDLL